MHILIVLAIVTFIIIIIITNKNRTNKSGSTYYNPFIKPMPINNDNTIFQNYPYRATNILTNNELEFYYRLKPIADKYNLHILSKIRIADIIEVDDTKTSNREYIKYFNKISRKHIDFALCNPNTLNILVLIELDDNSHNRKDRIERDNFVNTICYQTGYTLLRLRSNDIIEEKLLNLGIIKAVI